jgi:Effector-associated domain 11/WG containing repeat
LKNNDKIKFIRELIASGDLDKAFILFNEICNADTSFNQIKIDGLLLVSRYNNLKKERLLGIISEFEPKVNSITHSLLILIQQFESADSDTTNHLQESVTALTQRFLSTTDNVTEIERIYHECELLLQIYPNNFELHLLSNKIKQALIWHEPKNAPNNLPPKNTIRVDKHIDGCFSPIIIIIVVISCIFSYKRCASDKHIEKIHVKESAKIDSLSNQNIQKTLTLVDYDSISTQLTAFFLEDNNEYFDLIDTLINNSHADLAIRAFQDAREKTIQPGKIKHINDYIKSIKLAQERGFNNTYWDFPTKYNLILTEKNSKFGLFSRKGIEITPPIYDDIDPLLFSTLLVINAGDKFGFLNAEGKEIIPPILSDFIPQEGSDLILIRENNLCGIIDTFGKIILPVKYEDIDFPDSKGYIRFKKAEQWGFINKKEKLLIPILFDSISPFINDVAFSIHKGEIKYINRKGKFIPNPIFNEQ